MYILIDTDIMAVKAKHPNYSHLAEYSYLVCPDACHVLPLDITSLSTFTDVQLQQLYINTTGIKTGAMFSKVVLTKVLAYYFNGMEETLIGDDVGAQCNYAIDNKLEGFCKYAQGKQVPVPVTTPEPFLTYSKDSSAELGISEGSIKVQVNQGHQSPYKPERESPAPVARSNTVSTGSPRTSDTRDTIYATADEMWEAAGRPTEKSEVLKLRKKIMDALELQGVKRNTSSNTLGKWHLERAPF